MSLDRIALSDFRNHRDTRLSGARQFNLLLGPNGAGKTNVLEAISLFAPGRGLRRAVLSQMVRGDACAGFAIGADLVSGQTPVRLGTTMRSEAPGRRVVLASGSPLPAARLAEWLSVSWLTPSMDGLFTDSATARRRFLDRMTAAVSPAHATHSAKYERALRERNRILGGEGGADPQWLDALEREMAEAGEAIGAGRAALLSRLAERIEALPDGPFARPDAVLDTASSLDLAAALKENRPIDRRAGRTLVGPHRADLKVSLVPPSGPPRPAHSCSTGEQKALLVSLVVAHAEIASGSRPLVLLLDEIAAHLDPVRREALFSRLADSGAQIWMTGTENEPFAAIADVARSWHLENGALRGADEA